MATSSTYAIPDERQPFTPENILVEDLYLDTRNPRIQRVGETLNQEQILKILWEEYSRRRGGFVHCAERFLPARALVCRRGGMANT